MVEAADDDAGGARGDEQVVRVDLGLDERAGGRLVDGKVVQRTRHARTRFVAKPARTVRRPPQLGDPWCTLTVRARLHRVGWVLRKDPRVGPRENPGSCMPETVREAWKDQKGEPMRIPVPAADQDAVNVVLRDLLRFRFDDEAKAVVYSIIGKAGGDSLAETLGCSDTHARKLQNRMLERLVVDWNAQLWRPDERDIERARKFIHRNIK